MNATKRDEDEWFIRESCGQIACDASMSGVVADWLIARFCRATVQPDTLLERLDAVSDARVCGVFGQLNSPFGEKIEAESIRRRFRALLTELSSHTGEKK